MNETAKVETLYLSCAETAVLVRKALKEAFPGVKFSVKSKTYSGGASISVRWLNGPRAGKVDEVIGQFAGADFDGMQDLKTYVTHQVNGRSVRYGSDYVFSYRDVSWDGYREEFDAYIRQHCTLEPHDRFGGFYVSDLVSRMIRDRDEKETIEQTFRRMVLRQVPDNG